MKRLGVGVKVRIVRYDGPFPLQGLTGVIVAYGPDVHPQLWPWVVKIATTTVTHPPSCIPSDCWSFLSDHLEPLVDEKFADFMKTLTRKPDPVQPALPPIVHTELKRTLTDVSHEFKQNITIPGRNYWDGK